MRFARSHGVEIDFDEPPLPDYEITPESRRLKFINPSDDALQDEIEAVESPLRLPWELLRTAGDDAVYSADEANGARISNPWACAAFFISPGAAAHAVAAPNTTAAAAVAASGSAPGDEYVPDDEYVLDNEDRGDNEGWGDNEALGDNTDLGDNEVPGDEDTEEEFEVYNYDPSEASDEEDNDSTAPSEPEVEEDPADKTFRIRASSKHLIMASPMFKSMLTSGWKEANEFRKTGFADLTTSGWDMDAFSIVLKILHGKQHEIPRFEEIEKIAKVGMIADYYCCQELVRAAALPWLIRLPKEVPNTCSYRDLVLWIWVSHFYQLPEHFTAATAIAISQATGEIDPLGIPISTEIIDGLNSRRIEEMERMLQHTYSIRDRFEKEALGCNTKCRSKMLRALNRNLGKQKLLASDLKHPYTGHSQMSFKQTIDDFVIPKWFDEDPEGSAASSFPRPKKAYHTCRASRLSIITSEFPSFIVGLRLEDYTPFSRYDPLIY
ncbi:hypothetical protein BO71DRAFT_319663 [Aspergillus ellipticus CBS 707.79]|uniref:BTB domain-containing protein n=1 Tax=Aspergillus ellipticus CBS 707.79 TaxID=1448320 RepID=A0A319DJ14_9EURO|nr:hypothetical protein BO71DRAFT_319663 [Aspergillus ellipticus CBS 707.79]